MAISDQLVIVPFKEVDTVEAKGNFLHSIIYLYSVVFTFMTKFQNFSHGALTIPRQCFYQCQQQNKHLAGNMISRYCN